MKHTKLFLAIIALVTAASPVLVQGAQHAFSHPTSLPKEASDNARKALAARGTHGHEGTETGEHDDNESATGAANEHEANDTDTDTDTGTDHESTTGAAHEANDTDTDHESTTGATHEQSENETAACGANSSLLAIVTFHAMPDFVQSVSRMPFAVGQVVGIEEGC